MPAGDEVVVDAALQVTAEIKSGPRTAAVGTLGFENVPLFGGLHRFNPLDDDPGNHHHPHLRTAASADRLKVLLLGISLHPGDLKFGLAAGGAGELIQLLLNFERLNRILLFDLVNFDQIVDRQADPG